MGRKLDLSSLTEEEAEHVLQVVQRDMQLREAEEDRLKELKQELEEEKSRCAVLSRQRGFNEHCCMRCCSPFAFLLAPRHTCLGCGYNVCRHCCRYTRARSGWLCSACQRTRLLKTRSLEWFYSSVRRRFKRFGSDKVLKTLYRRLTTGPRDSQGEFTGGSTYDESADNESSVYESDSTFYRHSKEHSMAETTSVARRVAEEAVDEAIAKSESQTLNQRKLKEAQYLQDNRGELIEELTTVIVQKIIHRKSVTPETQPEWPADGNSEASSPSTPRGRPHSSLGSKSSLSASLLRSQSALALHMEDVPDQEGKAEQESMFSPDCTQGLKKEGATGPALPSWKSVDRLDNSSASMLQSPDGNWITMQSTQLSRPSLLTKRKSLVFTALEKESGAVSAYDGLCSDTEADADGAWGTALLEFRHKMSSNNMSNDLRSPSPHSPTETTTENTQTDSGQETPVLKPPKGQVPVLKRKVPREHRCSSVLDMNLSPDSTESSEEGSENSRAKRTRRKRRNKQGCAEEEGFKNLPSTEPDYSRMLLDVLVNHRSKRQAASEVVNDKPLEDTSDTTTPDAGSTGAVTPGAPVVEQPGSEHRVVTGSSDHQLTYPLVQLTGPFREMKDDLDKEVEMVGEGNENREKEREGGTGKASWDVEAGEGLEDLGEIEHGEERQEGKKPPLVWKHRAKMVMLDEEGPGPVEEGNIVIPAETAGEAKEHEESEADDIKPDEWSRCPSVTASCRSERSGEEELVEETDSRHTGNIDYEQVKHQEDTWGEQEGQSGWKPEKQAEGAGGEAEEAERGREARSCGNQEQTAETASTAKTEESERAPERWKKAVKNRCDELDLTRSEEEAEYERMIDSVVQALDNMEREIEADLCDAKSDVTAEPGEEDEEIGGEQKEEKEMTWVVEMEEDVKMKQDKESVSVDKPLQGRLMGKELEHDWVQTTQEKSCNMKAEEFRDHEFKEDLDSAPSGQEEFLTPEEIYKKYSAASLRSITTEVLKVLNATEDLIRGTMGDGVSQSESPDRPPLPPAQSKKMDEQLSHLEEKVYVAASAAFSLEAELEELAECAHSVCSATTEGELAHLEEQVASAAAQVTDIAARIAALKNAGLNVVPQTRVTKLQTIDSCRQHRRRLPVPPVQEKKA